MQLVLNFSPQTQAIKNKQTKCVKVTFTFSHSVSVFSLILPDVGHVLSYGSGLLLQKLCASSGPSTLSGPPRSVLVPTETAPPPTYSSG